VFVDDTYPSVNGTHPSRATQNVIHYDRIRSALLQGLAVVDKPQSGKVASNSRKGSRGGTGVGTPASGACTPAASPGAKRSRLEGLGDGPSSVGLTRPFMQVCVP
jgi:hypothetical protein